jgi:hypothetical protein
MNLTRHLTPRPPDSQQVRHRVLPSQPAGLQPGEVFCGFDLGFLPYTGPQPQAGDLVIIMEDRGRRLVQSQASVNTFVPALTSPTFNFGCSCKCPGGSGMAFYMQSVARNTAIMAINVMTGGLAQVFGFGDLWYGRGIAVDNTTPYPLYVLDDRRILTKPILTTALTPTRGYFTLVSFAVSAGQYAVSGYHDLADPLPPPASTAGFPGIGFETQDQDPPNFTRQGLSVIGGIPHLTLYNAPARFLTLTGGVFNATSLTVNGAPLAMGLRGQIVTIPDQPAKKSNRYCLATDGAAFQLLQFTRDGAVTARLTLDGEPQPAQLATVCNHLLALSTDTLTPTPSEENSP